MNRIGPILPPWNMIIIQRSGTTLFIIISLSESNRNWNIKIKGVVTHLNPWRKIGSFVSRWWRDAINCWAVELNHIEFDIKPRVFICTRSLSPCTSASSSEHSKTTAALLCSQSIRQKSKTVFFNGVWVRMYAFRCLYPYRKGNNNKIFNHLISF